MTERKNPKDFLPTFVPPTKWTPEMDAQLRFLKSDRHIVAAIAEALGVSAKAVRGRWAKIELAAMSVAAPRSGRHPLPPFDPVSWDPIVAGTCLEGLPRPTWHYPESRLTKPTETYYRRGC